MFHHRLSTKYLRNLKNKSPEFRIDLFEPHITLNIINKCESFQILSIEKIKRCTSTYETNYFNESTNTFSF